MIDTKKSCKNFECSLEISNIMLYYVTIIKVNTKITKKGKIIFTNLDTIN